MAKCGAYNIETKQRIRKGLHKGLKGSFQWPMKMINDET